MKYICREGLDEDVAKKWDHLPGIIKDFYKEQVLVKFKRLFNFLDFIHKGHIEEDIWDGLI